jgi:plasmid stabilization system protein ParE
MTFPVSITPRATSDIDRNASWWAEHHSVDQALRWVDAVYDQLDALADAPYRHGLSAENDDFQYEIRDKLVGLGARPTHRAVFTIKDDTVYVLTIRHAAQDAIRPDDVDAPRAE